MRRLTPILLLLVASQAFAANWFVRKGASGTANGTSWTNAWPDFNNIAFASVACGDTIWIAGNNGGTAYTGAMSGFKSCTSGTVVVIERATVNDAVAVASPGWFSTFDSQVVVNNVQTTMSGNWWTLDGRTGDAQSQVPYGIKFNNSTDGWLGVFANNSAGSITGITLAHIEVVGPACETQAANTCTGTNWGLRLDAGGSTGITVDHSWFHQFGEVIHGPTNASSNFVLQYSYIGEDTFINTAEHEDLLYTADPCGKMTFNANTWYSSGNDGIFMDFNGCNNGFVFTNNVMIGWGGWSIEFGKTGTCGPFTIVGNTFANNGLGSDGNGNEFAFGFMNDGGCTISTNSVATNNITYNMTIGDFTNAEATFNAGTRTNGFNFACGTGCFQYSIAAPIQSFNGFVTFTAAGTPYHLVIVQSDLHLSTAGKTLFQGKGTNLTAQCGTNPTFCTDRDGNTRPSAGNWDLGAFVAQASVTQVATPTFSPVAGTYATTQTVTISSTTASATICYTLDGTTPTANGAGTCTHGTTMANGGTVSVSTSETVQALGSLNGDTDSAVASATFTIGIPVASLSPASLNFGGINTSNTSAPQTLTLQNTGTAAMAITSISITGANAADFFQSNNCPVGSNLGNGASCTITVTFTPLAVGARSASVSVVDNASGSPHTSALSGTGVQALISGQLNPGARLSGKATLK